MKVRFVLAMMMAVVASSPAAALINLENGNYWTSDNDAPGTGLGRFYNSLCARPSQFGYGWTWMFDTTLSWQSDEFVLRYAGCGRKISYALTKESLATLQGLKVAPADLFKVLAQNPDNLTKGTIVLRKTRSDGFGPETLMLAPEGFVGIDDKVADGNKIAFNLRGQLSVAGGKIFNYMTDGRINSIEVLKSAQKLVFDYSNSNEIKATFSDDPKKTIVYALDDKGDLRAVRKIDGSVRTYRYDAHHNLTFENARGRAGSINIYDGRTGRTVVSYSAGCSEQQIYLGFPHSEAERYRSCSDGSTIHQHLVIQRAPGTGHIIKRSIFDATNETRNVDYFDSIGSIIFSMRGLTVEKNANRFMDQLRRRSIWWDSDGINLSSQSGDFGIDKITGATSTTTSPEAKAKASISDIELMRFSATPDNWQSAPDVIRVPREWTEGFKKLAIQTAKERREFGACLKFGRPSESRDSLAKQIYLLAEQETALDRASQENDEKKATESSKDISSLRMQIEKVALDAPVAKFEFNEVKTGAALRVHAPPICVGSELGHVHTHPVQDSRTIMQRPSETDVRTFAGNALFRGNQIAAVVGADERTAIHLATKTVRDLESPRDDNFEIVEQVRNRLRRNELLTLQLIEDEQTSLSVSATLLAKLGIVAYVGDLSTLKKVPLLERFRNDLIILEKGELNPSRNLISASYVVAQELVTNNKGNNNFIEKIRQLAKKISSLKNEEYLDAMSRLSTNMDPRDTTTSDQTTLGACSAIDLALKKTAGPTYISKRIAYSPKCTMGADHKMQYGSCLSASKQDPFVVWNLKIEDSRPNADTKPYVMLSWKDSISTDKCQNEAYYLNADGTPGAHITSWVQ